MMSLRLLVLVLLLGALAPAQAGVTPGLRVALLGNPNSVPEWNDAQVQGLVKAGFNAVQLNVAWGSRPQNEPLN
jgi:hypothetical protein